MNIDELYRLLATARDSFLKNDRWLLQVNANERSMTHKFAEYLSQLVSPLDVDCEYNRDGYDPKRMIYSIPTEDVKTNDEDARTVFPDIIVHRRGTDENIIVIEAKKSSGDQARDVEKLKLFVHPLGLNYKFGVSLLFQTVGDPDITYDVVAINPNFERS